MVVRGGELQFELKDLIIWQRRRSYDPCMMISVAIWAQAITSFRVQRGQHGLKTAQRCQKRCLRANRIAEEYLGRVLYCWSGFCHAYFFRVQSVSSSIQMAISSGIYRLLASQSLAEAEVEKRAPVSPTSPLGVRWFRVEQTQKLIKLITPSG